MPDIIDTVQLVPMSDRLVEASLPKDDALAYRKEGLKRFDDLPMPFRIDEEWRRTELTKFDFSDCPPAAKPVQGPADLLRHFSRSDQRSEKKFSALNDAFFGPLSVVHVRKGETPEPFHLRTRVGKEVTSCPRTIIRVESGAEAVVVDELEGAGGGLCVRHVDLIVEPGAQLRYFSLQNLPLSTVLLDTVYAVTRRDARLDAASVDVGARLVKRTADFFLRETGGESRVQGMVSARGRQHFDLAVNVFHTAPGATSDVFFKNALQDRSKTIFTGTIQVTKEAQKTDSYEKNLNLLLSRRARADAIPRLEILADDVKCGHGAAVGTLEEEPLFYLMSRGLDRAAAERLIVEGFFEEVIGRTSGPDWIRNRMRELALSNLK